MAHPLAQNVSPFLLLLFGTNSDFEHTDVLQRWRYISSQLKSYVYGLSMRSFPISYLQDEFKHFFMRKKYHSSFFLVKYMLYNKISDMASK